MNESILSDKLYSRAFLAQMNKISPIKELSWTKGFFYWIIDSKYRVSKRLDLFLKDQLVNPSIELRDIALGLRRNTTDETVISVLKYVKNNFSYEFDKDNYGSSEYWAKATEILSKGSDDCDGLNSLVYVLCRLAGVPDFLLWNMLGSVNGGYHYWLTYFSPECNKLVVLDSTYWFSPVSVSLRPSFLLSDSKYVSVDYCFNESFSFKGVFKW